MDKLGQRIVDDRQAITDKLHEAVRLEQQARKLRQEAGEMERLLQLARMTSHS